MHLRNSRDMKTVLWAVGLAPAAVVLQYALPRLAGCMLPVSMYLAYCAGVIAHNHNHRHTFYGKKANELWSAWISFFYGYPAFAWIPTHNVNHHKFVDRPGDVTATRSSHAPRSPVRRAMAAAAYPFVSAAAQRPLISDFLRRTKERDRRAYRSYLGQYAVVWGGHLFACALAIWLHGWSRGLVVYASALGLPALAALWGLMFTNYVQHVDCDPWSRWNHSRNFVSPWMNQLFFDNGFHTAHHEHPGTHWSDLRAQHARIADLIDPSLEERTVVGYCFEEWVLGGIRPVRRLTRPAEAAKDGLPSGVPVPRHVFSDLGDIGVVDRGLVDDRSLTHDEDPVGEGKHLVEVGAHQEDGHASVPSVEESRPDLGNGGEVQTEAGVGDDQHLRLAL